MDQSTSLFAPIPKLEDLWCIRCIFSEWQIVHEIFKTVKHCQIICCREIMKNFPTVIATPIPSTFNYVYVIMSKKFYETKRLQQYLEYRIINHTSPQRVTEKIFKMCIKNTITYKLFPVWNKIDEYLCVGENFQVLADEFDAINFDVDIKDEEMILKLNSLRIKVDPLSLEAIGAPETNSESAFNNPKWFKRLHVQKAFILPGFKKCKLLKVLKEIPQTNEFKSYSLICDHWKHMYGIILPRNQKNINYYQVSIPKFQNRILVYPEFCLKTSLPKIIKRNNVTEISNRFIEDLKAKVTQVCGKELIFNCHSPKLSTNFVQPLKVQKEVYATPKSTLVKNPCFNGSFNSFKLLNSDPRNLKNLLFQMNVNSPTKSFSSNCSSFSFKNSIQTNNSLKREVSGTYSNGEFVKNWLFNSCTSQTSSTEVGSSNSKEEFESMKESPFKPNCSNTKKPSVRSIEPVQFCLSNFKKKKI